MKLKKRCLEDLPEVLRKIIQTEDELAEMERRLEEARAYRRMQSKPELDAIRESQRLTAADFLITINCGDEV